MQHRLIALIACAALCLPLAAADSHGWLTDPAKATAQAATAGKPVLIDFTGSDWCSWCIKLRKEVFDTPEFKTWAQERVVLLELDFPQAGNQPAAEKKRNNDLAERYGIEGFPTVVITDAAGKELGRLGYQPGGATAWITAAEAILPRKP